MKKERKTKDQYSLEERLFRGVNTGEESTVGRICEPAVTFRVGSERVGELWMRSHHSEEVDDTNVGRGDNMTSNDFTARFYSAAGMTAGLSERGPWQKLDVMASAEREPMTAVGGRSPQRGSRGQSPRWGVRGAKPREAECHLYFACPKEAANLPTLLMYFHITAD